MSIASPAFRTAEPGYEPDEVDEHVAVVREVVVDLERRVDEVTAQALAAEAAAARAEAHATVPAPADDELLTVVFDGQRQADDLLARAEEQAAARHREADLRIAELRDDSEVRRLTAAVDDTRRRLHDAREALRRVDEDLRVTAEATRQCHTVVDQRLAAAMADLAETELVTERT